jgi:predicted lipid carrier protein YhbT
VATVRQCHSALTRLAKSLDDLDPELRAKHVPTRSVCCRVSDLDVTFTGWIDADGVHDLARGEADEAADVRVVLSSQDLLAIAEGRDDVLHAWLGGRMQISAPVRDVLRLRSLLGM